jgi:cytochrome P450
MPQTVKLIESHIADPTAQDDLLSTRLRAKTADDGQPEHEAIISEMMQLLFAGHHSIPTTLLWLWVSLARYPAIEAEVHRQLEQACTAEFLTEPPVQLPYVDWVLQETMRVYSPLVLLPRQLTSGLTLDGYGLPPGATIWVCPPLIHHDPRYYEAPAEFRPERFAPHQAHPIPKYAYLPFGVGPRLCIGRALALMIMRLITATIARRYRLVLPAGQPVEPKVTLTLRPAAELWMQLEERQ